MSVTTSTPGAISPLLQLEGLVLDGGWKVGPLLQKAADQTGGHCSSGYECIGPTGERAFLKAIDLTEALRATDVLQALQTLADAAVCEMELLDVCKHMDRVVSTLANGYIRELNNQSLMPPIPYIIFERADGNTRSVVRKSQRPTHSWCLQTLHHVTTGLRQLHAKKIAHLDLKTSNVLLYHNDRQAKISDLGRSVKQDRPVWYDKTPWPGDRSYRPPEVIYGFLPAEFNTRRLAADMFLLGNFACILFVGTPLTTLIAQHLQSDFKPPQFTGTFESVLPHLHAAFEAALQDVASVLPKNAPYRDAVIQCITQWCQPDPRDRGHSLTRARNMKHGNIYELERYVSWLQNLAHGAAIFERQQNRT